MPRKKTNKTLTGRPLGQFGPPNKPIDRAVVRRSAALGCTATEIATICGVTRDTFYRRLKADPELKQQLEEGRDHGKVHLRKLQWKQANEGNVTMQIWLGKQLLGQKDKTEVSGDADQPLTIMHLMAARQFSEQLHGQGPRTIDAVLVEDEQPAEEPKTPRDLMAPALE